MNKHKQTDGQTNRQKKEWTNKQTNEWNGHTD